MRIGSVERKKKCAKSDKSDKRGGVELAKRAKSFVS
jgi:hypothetical protein